MRYFLLVMFCVALLPPVPDLPHPKRWRKQPTGRADMLLRTVKSAAGQPPRIIVIPFRYFSIASGYYTYDLQSTTNLVNWVVEQVNVPADQDVTVTNHYEPVKLFRIHGRR